MSIRTALVKALARTEVPWELGNGNGAEPEETKALSIVPDSLGYPSTAVFWPQHWDGTVGRSQELSRWTAYAGSALAYICMNYRAQKLQEPPLMVVEETDDGEEWIEDHELNGLLARPNPDFAMRRMLVLTSLFRDITGSALWLKVRNRGKLGAPERLYAFSGDAFTVESTADRLFGKFKITIRGGQLEVGPEDVIFFAGIDPSNPLGAISPLDVALSMLGIGSTLQGSAKTALLNAVQPGGAISVPETLNDPEFDAMMGQLLQQHGGPANRGKPLLLTGGATWQTIQWTLAEMMPTEVISWVEATVCAVFQLHPSMLGLKSGLDMAPGLGGTQVKTAERMAYDNFAIPRWTADAEILTDSLLRDVDDDESHLIKFDTADIAALQDDELEKADILSKIQHCLTINEQRQRMGYAPLTAGDEIGETIFIPATWMPAGMLVNPPEPKPVPAPFGGAEDEEGGAVDDEAPPNTEEEE